LGFPTGEIPQDTCSALSDEKARTLLGQFSRSRPVLEKSPKMCSHEICLKRKNAIFQLSLNVPRWARTYLKELFNADLTASRAAGNAA
jgi:hypothetical protein